MFTCKTHSHIYNDRCSFLSKSFYKLIVSGCSKVGYNDLTVSVSLTCVYYYINAICCLILNKILI